MRAPFIAIGTPTNSRRRRCPHRLRRTDGPRSVQSEAQVLHLGYHHHLLTTSPRARCHFTMSLCSGVICLQLFYIGIYLLLPIDISKFIHTQVVELHYGDTPKMLCQ